ncbi:hypothetical protein [Lacinutrix sp. Hel_I_90]|uniref:hypothetical protein n=1 Tax=Lacinutrix sp. Hel_I_90 TaxID=1249999 RepID=UPI0005C885B6|nr:hypothetical protein [Lacinutrix sp. Hel_I_90]
MKNILFLIFGIVICPFGISQENTRVDYSELTVQNPPVYEGCANATNREKNINCFEKSIKKFITSNFNYQIINGIEEEIKASQKSSLFNVRPRILIETDGTTSLPEEWYENARIRKQFPTLFEELERIVALIPKMHSPAKEDGNPIRSSYQQIMRFQIK